MDHPRRLLATVSTHVLIVSPETRRLLLVRLAYGDHRHRKWALPGGFVDAGEGLETALLREVREEVGLTLSAPRQVGVNSFLEQSHPHVGFLFHTDSWRGEVVPGSREILETLWADEATFARLFLDNELAYPEMAQQVECLGWRVPARPVVDGE